GEPLMPWIGRSRSVRSDRTGTFTINGVVNGSYTLVAIAPVLLTRGDAGHVAPSGAGTSTAFTSGTVSGVISGFVGGGVTTETINGVTTQYRDDAGTCVAVTVNAATVQGLAITVRTAK